MCFPSGKFTWMRAGGDTHSTANPPRLNAWACSPPDVHLAPGNPTPVPTYCYHGLRFTLYHASLTALNRPICIGGGASPKGRPSNFAAYVFVLTISVRHWKEACRRSFYLLSPYRDYRTLRRASGGGMPLVDPTCRRTPSNISFRGTPERLRREGRWESHAWRARRLFLG